MAEYTPPKRPLLPIKIIQHEPSNSASDSTSTDKEDVQKETAEELSQEKESKWFEVFAGILVSTIPMVLGGYLLHVLTSRNSGSDNSSSSLSEPAPKKHIKTGDFRRSGSRRTKLNCYSVDEINKWDCKPKNLLLRKQN